MIPLSKGMKVLETAVGANFAPTRLSLVRISVRDLVADGKSLVRNCGVGGGGQNRIFKKFYYPPPPRPSTAGHKAFVRGWGRGAYFEGLVSIN